MQDCDDTCNFIIDYVKEAAGKSEEIKEEVEEEKKVEDSDHKQKEKYVVKPKAFWKFAIKAAYVKSLALATCMEFAKPKKLM